MYVCVCACEQARVLYNVWRSTNTILTTFPHKTPFSSNYKIHALCGKSGSTQCCKRNNHKQQFGLFLIRFLAMHISLKSCGLPLPPTLNVISYYLSLLKKLIFSYTLLFYVERLLIKNCYVNCLATSTQRRLSLSSKSRQYMIPK